VGGGDRDGQPLLVIDLLQFWRCSIYMYVHFNMVSVVLPEMYTVKLEVCDDGTYHHHHSPGQSI
jgi:hypothetical protein